MKVSCPECGARYRIDEAKIPDKGVSLSCRKCSCRFSIQKPAGPAVSTPPPAAAPDLQPPKQTHSQPTDSRLAEVEQQLSRFAQAGDEDACVRYIVEQVTRFAKNCEFGLAETLRSRLYDVAPMALSDIIRCAEIIETAKHDAMDQTQMKLWAGLYDGLEPGEDSELYFALKTVRVDKGQVVFKQGDFDSKLYFIQDGSFEMDCFVPRRNEQVYLGELIAGDVTNMESFFRYTICTYTLKARRNGQISYLKKDILADWKENYPGLEPKLLSFCSEKDVFGKKMAELGFNKRIFERYQTSAKAKIQLLNEAGQPAQKPFKIPLFDISRGGVGFGMKVNKPQEAEMLLQHRLFMQIIYRDGAENKKIGFKGRVVAVHLQPFGDSSIHVQFDEIQNIDTVMKLTG